MPSLIDSLWHSRHLRRSVAFLVVLAVRISSGQLLPFKLAGYLFTSGSGTSTTIQFSPTYQFGNGGAPPIEAFVYPSSFNFPSNSTGPFRLAYASPSLLGADSGASACPGNSSFQCFNAILIYQLNPNYVAP